MVWITDKIKKNWTKIFPLFYEEIVRNWLVKKYTLTDLDVIQPRIYYWQQEKIKDYEELDLLDKVVIDYNEDVDLGKKKHQEIEKGAKKRERYFCADGFYLDNNGKKILMEAKSWIPPHTTDGRLENNPHALYFSLVNKATIKGQLEEIDRFFLVYWSAEADGSGKRKEKGEEFHKIGKKIHEKLIDQWTQIRPDKELKIIYIIDIFEELIEKQSDWYKKILTKEGAECKELFDWLLRKSV